MSIRFTMDAGDPTCVAEIPPNRYGVYLDNWAIIELAVGDASRQDRFLKALTRGGELLFSWTNAAELWGPQGYSAAQIREFLGAIGAYWIPLEANPFTVARRECEGMSRERTAISATFIKAYFAQRAFEMSSEGKAVIDLSEGFFSLEAVVDWAQKKRDSTRADLQRLDDSLSGLVGHYQKNVDLMDNEFPPIPYDHQRPASFALAHLVRNLVTDAKVEKGDGADLCHAVLGTAYGSVATLDKRWKRRVECLPKPNELARIFYKPQLDELVGTLEALVARSDSRTRGSGDVEHHCGPGPASRVPPDRFHD